MEEKQKADKKPCSWPFPAQTLGRKAPQGIPAGRMGTNRNRRKITPTLTAGNPAAPQVPLQTASQKSCPGTPPMLCVLTQLSSDMGLGDPGEGVWQHRFPGPAQLPPTWLVASWGRWSPIGWLLFLSPGKPVPGRIRLAGPTGRTGGTASSPPPAPGQQGLCSTCTHRQAGGQSQPPSLAAPPPSEGRHSRHRGGTSLLSLPLLGPQHRSGTGKPTLQVGHAHTQKPASPSPAGQTSRRTAGKVARGQRAGTLEKTRALRSQAGSRAAQGKEESESEVRKRGDSRLNQRSWELRALGRSGGVPASGGPQEGRRG